ncbi:MAG: tetratricopeptide repeat protein [Proteobacteria bacterium]|nr:tetratricopeptide repeat protein [Pseudomonadota bacterium]
MRTIMLGMVIFLAASTSQASGQNRLNALASSTGKDAEALVVLGDLYVEAMQLGKAKKAYRDALRIKKKFGEAQFGLARIQMAQGKFKPAKRACKKIEKQNKNGSVGEVCAGWFWIKNDRAARAMDEFQKVIQEGDEARGKTGMGEAYRRRGDYDEAVTAYREAIDAGADYIAHIGLGLTLEIKEDYKTAASALERAVSKQPASCLAHYHYGRLSKPGKKAISHLEDALAIRPKWPEAYVALGEVYLKTGNNEAAAQAFQGALKGKSGRGAAYYGLGKALHKMGKKDEALSALNKSIELIPNQVDAYIMVAEIQYASGDEKVAIQALDKARNAAPGDVKVYLYSGDVYFRMGRYTSARSLLSQAVSMYSKLSKAHAILGHIACERRLYDAGKQHYGRALKGDMVDVDKKDIDKRIAACKPKR